MPLMEMISGIGLSIVANRLDAFIVDKLPPGHRRKLFLATFKKTDIRVSIAYLYRIELDGSYLLVKGKRINQYQPVGGVRKFYKGAQSTFRELGVRPDDFLKIDDISRDDLRVRMPAKNLLKFLDWYETKHDREICQQREFREELIAPGYLKPETFTDLEVQYLYTVPTFHYSPHFQCWELLYHEVFEPVFTPGQVAAVQKLKEGSSDEYVWVAEELILSLGHDKRLGMKPFQIGDHAQLLISKDNRLFKH
ncbi:SMODS-associated NUDIX domain-containing protein [Fibrivirga algicola]|uniref:CD-NTase-associated protein 16 NUDIX domain-containing protein n=1 Tax=Fibrivirga algicola TaxID=2950420 RepID=A0ABX0QLY9_9BACT|nr:hypothetical protein [Fibrivirga algicola]NID13511.1 hypothetical protein [Fibrivirga algicola]